MHPDATPAPTAASLDALPQGVLADILVRSGLHTRQVGRAFRDTHPPLLSVAPRGVSTPEQLTAALSALPASITSLDLRHVDPNIMLHAALDAMPAALCNLQRLTLPPSPPATFSAILRTPHLLPHLHTLHATLPIGLPFPNHQEQEERRAIPWPALLKPPAATRLRSLTLPLHALLALCKAPRASLPQLTGLALLGGFGPAATWCVHAADLADLLVPAPALRHLALGGGLFSPGLQEPGHLAALTTLTSLSLSDLEAATHTTDDMLHALGTLTALRSLRLLHHDYTGVWSAGRGARELSHLHLLTRLHVNLGFYEQDGDGNPTPVSEIVLQLVDVAVALPQLQQLQLGFYPIETMQPAWPDWHSFFHRLAAATQLRHLHLYDLPLPLLGACLLTCLQGLTALRLWGCWVPSPEPGQAAAGERAVAGESWVAALSGLRQLSVETCDASLAPLLQWHAGALPHLHTLALRNMDLSNRDYLGNRLVGLQGSLVRLDLGGSPAAWDAGVLRVLGGMQRLRVLDLRCEFREAHVQHCEHHLRLPSSLRRCYLWSDRAVPSSCRDALARLRARHPLVDFRLQPRLPPSRWHDANEW